MLHAAANVDGIVMGNLGGQSTQAITEPDGCASVPDGEITDAEGQELTLFLTNLITTWIWSGKLLKCHLENIFEEFKVVKYPPIHVIQSP